MQTVRNERFYWLNHRMRPLRANPRGSRMRAAQWSLTHVTPEHELQLGVTWGLVVGRDLFSTRGLRRGQNCQVVSHVHLSIVVEGIAFGGREVEFAPILNGVPANRQGH